MNTPFAEDIVTSEGRYAPPRPARQNLNRRIALAVRLSFCYFLKELKEELVLSQKARTNPA